MWNWFWGKVSCLGILLTVDVKVFLWGSLREEKSGEGQTWPGTSDGLGPNLRGKTMPANTELFIKGRIVLKHFK